MACGRPLAAGRLTYCDACLQGPPEPSVDSAGRPVLTAFSGILTVLGTLGFAGCLAGLVLGFSMRGPTTAQWAVLGLLVVSFAFLFQGLASGQTPEERSAPDPAKTGGDLAAAATAAVIVADKDTWNFIDDIGIYLAPFGIVAVVGAVFYGPIVAAILVGKTAWETAGWLLSRRGIELAASLGFVLLSMLLIAVGWWGIFLALVFFSLLVLSVVHGRRAPG